MQPATSQPIITGLHHVTAFAKDPRANLDFYTRVLGLRLVKKTVNFDDPFTYHLYYGDRTGSPGTLLTHFPNPRAGRARHGNNEITDAILALRPGSLSSLRDRLQSLGVATRNEQLLGSHAIGFDDPDGMRMLAVDDREETRAAANADTPIAQIDGVVIHVPDPRETEEFLTSTIGFTRSRTDGNAIEFTLGPGDAGRRLILIHDTAATAQPMGAGTIHHVAWRVPDQTAQTRVAESIRAFGVGVTPIIDRQYFQSIYFRIPGGVVFEVATDQPGFATDEPVESLGQALRLPPQHESLRERLEQTLVQL